MLVGNFFKPALSARKSFPEWHDFQGYSQTSPNIIYHDSVWSAEGLETAHCTLTHEAPEPCSVTTGRRACAVPPEHSFQGVKKRDHTKVDVLSRGLLRVVYSMYSAMASQNGHQVTPRKLAAAPGGVCEGARALKGGQTRGTWWTGRRMLGTTSPTPAVLSGPIHRSGPR